MTDNNSPDADSGSGKRRLICVIAASVLAILLGPLASIFLRGIYSFITGGIAGGAAAYAVIAVLRRTKIHTAAGAAAVIISGAVSFLLGLVFTSSVRDAAADAVYVLPALAAISFPDLINRPEDKRSPSRTSVIVRAAVAVAVGFIIYMAVVIAVDGGGFSLSVYKEWLEGENERMREIMSSLSTVRGGEMSAIYENERLDSVSAYLIMTLPGVMAICFFISAWLSTVAYTLLLRADGSYKIEFPDGWKVSISTVSCVIYILAYLGSGFFGSADAVYAVCGNLVLLLTPGLTLLGISGVAERFADEDRRGTAIIMTVISLASLILSPLFFFTLMSFAGEYYTLAPRIKKKLGRE